MTTSPENRQLRAVFILVAAVAICAVLAIWGLLLIIAGGA